MEEPLYRIGSEIIYTSVSGQEVAGRVFKIGEEGGEPLYFAEVGPGGGKIKFHEEAHNVRLKDAEKEKKSSGRKSASPSIGVDELKRASATPNAASTPVERFACLFPPCSDSFDTPTQRADHVLSQHKEEAAQALTERVNTELARADSIEQIEPEPALTEDIAPTINAPSTSNSTEGDRPMAPRSKLDEIRARVEAAKAKSAKPTEKPTKKAKAEKLAKQPKKIELPKLSRENKRKTQMTAVAQLIKDGNSPDEIATLLQRSRGNVYALTRAAVKAGLLPKPERVKKERVAKERKTRTPRESLDETPAQLTGSMSGLTIEVPSMRALHEMQSLCADLAARVNSLEGANVELAEQLVALAPLAALLGKK